MIEFVDMHGLDDLKKSLHTMAKYNQGLFKSAPQRDFLFKKYGDDRSQSLAVRIHRDYPGIFSSLIKPTHVFRFACEMRGLFGRRSTYLGTMDTFAAVDEFGVIAIFKIKDTGKNKETTVSFVRDPHLKPKAPPTPEKAPGYEYSKINEACGEAGSRCIVEGKVVDVIALKSGYSTHVTYVDCDGRKLQYWGLLRDKASEEPIKKGQTVKIDGKLKKVDQSEKETVSVMGRIYSSHILTAAPF